MAGALAVAEVITAPLAAGKRLLVVSDLSLVQRPSPSATRAGQAIAEALRSWSGLTMVVIAGDLFDLLDPTAGAVGTILTTHADLRDALARWSCQPGHQLIVLPGERDGELAWNSDAAHQLRQATGAELALVVDIEVERHGGTARLRVEHGHQLDPSSAFTDPGDPLDSPLAVHVAREVLPGMDERSGDWLDGIQALPGPGSLRGFLASRTLYRRLGRRAWVLGVLAAVALMAQVPFLLTLFHDVDESLADSVTRTLSFLAVNALILALLVGSSATILLRRSWSSLTALGPASLGTDPNARSRNDARRLIGEQGYSGLVVGHTRSAELTRLQDGFYANCGSCADVTGATPGRYGFPPVYSVVRPVTLLEVEAGADLHVRLRYGAVPLPAGSLVERLIAVPERGTPRDLEVVAELPGGLSWPPHTDDQAIVRRHRRVAAAAIGFAGVLDVLSAVFPPFVRFEWVDRLVPLAVSQAATAVVLLSGVALLLLARGILRGQHRAFQITVALLAGTLGLHLLEGWPTPEFVLAAIVLLYLLANRRSFRAATERGVVRRAVPIVVGAVALACVAGVAVVQIFAWEQVGWWDSLQAVAERMIGIESVDLPRRVNNVLTPAMLTVTVLLVITLGWQVFRPVFLRRLGPTSDIARARDIVARHGRGTLDYFALRDDKRWWFDGDGLVAYGLFGSVCLVSPDPIGPEGDGGRLWSGFLQFADAQGWTVAVLGAGEEWLPLYEAGGMRSMYVGDEAIAEADHFTLDGGRNKSLRQAVNRVAKNGYTAAFYDPAHLEPELQASLLAMMGKSRRGEVERGFSMTLSRLFDPADEGLLLAVCFGPTGDPVAFCQYVPASGVDGWSLDVMRRDDGDHPNGIIDFLIVRTLEHLRDLGKRGLGLNFATMRAVMAGETADGFVDRVVRTTMGRMSDTMQIESLWRFNAKFDPIWQARYLVYPGTDQLVPVALAVAKAEQFWEIPVIGRFLARGETDETREETATPV